MIPELSSTSYSPNAQRTIPFCIAEYIYMQTLMIWLSERLKISKMNGFVSSLDLILYMMKNFI